MGGGRRERDIQTETERWGGGEERDRETKTKNEKKSEKEKGTKGKTMCKVFIDEQNFLKDSDDYFDHVT